MSLNPYLAPSSQVSTDPDATPPRRIAALIYLGVAGGCFFCIDAIYVIYWIAGRAAQRAGLSTVFDDYSFDITAAIMILGAAAITVGIYRRSRICSILLHLLALTPFVIVLVRSKELPHWSWSTLASLALLALSMAGVIGTVLYHRREKTIAKRAETA